MLWFKYDYGGVENYVNLDRYIVAFNSSGKVYLAVIGGSEELCVDDPKDVARLRKLLDVEIKLQRLIVPPEAGT